MLSITMTLFGGILLKTNTQDEDPYGAALLSGLLVGVNVGIVILFFYQGFLVLAKPPDPSAVKVQKQALIKIVTKGLEKCQPQIENAVVALGLDEKSAAALSDFLRNAISRIPVVLSSIDDIDDIVEDLQGSLFNLENAAEILDKILKVTIKIIGKQAVQEMLVPIVESLLDQLITQIAAVTSVDPETATVERIKALGAGMTRYMMTGLNPFYRKWIKQIREVGLTDPERLVPRLEAIFKPNKELDDSEDELADAEEGE